MNWFLAQIEPSYAFAALMFAVSVGTLIFSVIQNKNKASSEYVDKLEERIRHLEEELEKCECALVSAQEKNFDLMKEIISITQKAAVNSASQIKQSGENHTQLDQIHVLVNNKMSEALKKIEELEATVKQQQQQLKKNGIH